jgi:hypothetical protein
MSTLTFPLSIHPIRFAPGTMVLMTCTAFAPHPIPRPSSSTTKHATEQERKTASHLSELVGRSTGDLGDPQRSQLGLEFIELGEEVGLVPAGSRWLFVKVDKKGRRYSSCICDLVDRRCRRIGV